MDVRLDHDAMQALVAKAVFDGLTPEKREDLIQGAIRSLLETPKSNERNYYGSKVAPIQEAFNRAVETVAMQHATRVLSEDPEFQARLQKLFADVAAKLFEEGESRYELVSGIANIIRNALTKDRY